MLLYHFTYEGHLENILAAGINRGDVPTSPRGGFNAPWLTRNSNPRQQGWQGDGEPVDEEITRRLFLEGHLGPNHKPGDVITAVDKTKIRFTVKIPRGDRKLVYWPRFAKKRLDSKWYRGLDKAGGSESKNWYIYRGTIPVDWIVQTERRTADGSYQPL